MTSSVRAPFTLDTWADVPDLTGPLAAAEGPGMAVFVVAKTYTGGDVEGTARGHALTTMGPGGASYVAQERITGRLLGREGSFVLEHAAVGGEGVAQVLRAEVVPGSGTGALAGLAGSGQLEHGLLQLEVDLPEGAPAAAG